jgi:hypothetical protein
VVLFNVTISCYYYTVLTLDEWNINRRDWWNGTDGEESSGTPQTNTSQRYIVVNKLHDSEWSCCRFISQSSYKQTRPLYIFLAGRTFFHIGLWSVPRFENRRQHSHIFFRFKWQGLRLQWQHCLKEDMHKMDTTMLDRNLP